MTYAKKRKESKKTKNCGERAEYYVPNFKYRMSNPAFYILLASFLKTPPFVKKKRIVHTEYL